MAKPRHLFAENGASFEPGAYAAEISMPSANVQQTIGGAAAGFVAGAFEQQAHVASAFIGHDFTNDLPKIDTTSQVGQQVGANVTATHVAEVKLSSTQDVKAQFVAAVEEYQKPLNAALASAGKNLGMDADSVQNSFNPSISSANGVVAAAAGAKVGAPVMKAVFNGISTATSVSEGISDVKSSFGKLSPKQEAQVAAQLVSQMIEKVNPQTGRPEAEIESNIPQKVLRDLHGKLTSGDPAQEAAAVTMIKQALMPPENQPEFAEIEATEAILQADVDSAQIIKPENDHLVQVAHRAGVDASEITLSQVADVAKVEAAGGDVVATVTTAEIQMFELPNYPATFSAQDINFAAKPDVESALAIKSSELEKVSFATMNREPDMRAFSNPSGMMA